MNSYAQSSTMWIIWSILTSLFLLILISGIVFFIFWYKKNNRIFLTTKKLVYFATYMSFFLIQALIFSPLVHLPIPFSFDNITTITIGFIFGPLEGILFGWVADSLRVFINGWSYSLLSSLLFPIIGLIAGIMGILYKKINKVNIWVSASIFQTIVFVVIIMAIMIGILLPSIISNKHLSIKEMVVPTFVFSGILFIILEIIFYYKIRGSNPEIDLFLISMLILVSLFGRIVELVIRPFVQYFTGVEKIYDVALITRVLSSSYLIPTITITSYVMIKTSLYVMDI